MIPFFLVDVFTDEPLSGNPLAVVPDADELDERLMARIAGELNQSETTFLLSPSQPGADYRLRSFTAAGVEVFGAGHNALGAWWWLADDRRFELSSAQITRIQELGGRLLPVEIASASGAPIDITMIQAAPSFGATVSDTARLARALRLEESELDADADPPWVVSTGAAHLLIGLRDREALMRTRPDAELLMEVLKEVGAQGCYLYCFDTIDPAATAHARFFNPAVGLWEDAATGSAAGPLACRLVKGGVVPDGARCVIEQGHCMGRPSRIEIVVRGTEVRMSGRGVVVAEGQLRVS